MGGGFFRNVQTFGPQPVNSEPSPTIVDGVYIVKHIFYCMFCIYYNLIRINVIEMQRLCTPSSMSKTLCIKVLAVRLGKVQNLWAGGRRFLGGLVFSPVHRRGTDFFDGLSGWGLVLF